MPNLNRAWHLVSRFIARTTAPPDVAHPDGGTPQRARRGRLYRFCEQVREWMQEAERDSDRVRQEAMRNERRAKRRALILLLKLLNPEQRQEFWKYRYFHVVGGSSGERYRIRADMIANIDVLQPDGTVKHRLCVRPAGEIPVYDVMAAQMLHLQDAQTELRFLRQGNILSALPENHVSLRTTWIS